MVNSIMMSRCMHDINALLPPTYDCNFSDRLHITEDVKQRLEQGLEWGELLSKENKGVTDKINEYGDKEEVCEAYLAECYFVKLWNLGTETEGYWEVGGFWNDYLE